ncbi:UDP-N-acetylmuramoyl-L-alanyl-D-glutamate--2,6-diaminopimelate ligase [Lichenibacterium dinghuense]|uniref:UDP-N-acetylmuramoyl-L-alanyl-D-glutamate--2, 6-diaminopimelate ligase n=1 Tax=Lichenibacterium dinghuense TaxID=2895977 RepID=UPI001F02166E|nr:UDP-N-acetylmuramoyl-L-alanyl-D-glutamate--2,6-diaminopimelate ligase [Lichenibacterium sp. 6Y81]
MTLGELLPGAVAECDRGIAVSGLTADSRAVAPGFAFFAVPGAKGDGVAYAAAAAAAGAVAVVSERPPEGLPDGVASVVVPDARRALSAAAARVHPAQPGTVVAVTGTSGKTSVAAFVRQIWAAAGLRAASMGTLGVVAPDGAVYGSLTTPDPITLHRDLDRLARDGVTHLALEASSHGLDQHRLDGARLAAGAFTNLSRDHLDYHPNVEHYLAAKLRLFTDLLAPGRPAVVDADGQVAERVVAAARARGLDVLTVGRAGTSIRLLSAEPDGFATRMVLRHADRERTLRLPLAGAFQVSNALVAAGLCIATGTAPAAAFAALEGLAGAPGRLERVGTRRGAPVVVDYAHKPDALEKVLATMRPYAPGRLVVVFGCGGDRDAGKRPIMGAIAARLADVVVVTDDNPRSEEPAAIRSAILAGAPGAAEIGDRAAAIAHAVALLGPGDALVVAGKGHETGQTARGVTLPFSDAAAVAEAIARLDP